MPSDLYDRPVGLLDLKQGSIISNATAGPWYHCQPYMALPSRMTIHGKVPGTRVDFVSTKKAPIHSKIISPAQGRDACMSSDDMAFIAEFNPVKVKALLGYIEYLERKLDEFRPCLFTGT